MKQLKYLLLLIPSLFVSCNHIQTVDFDSYISNEQLKKEILDYKRIHGQEIKKHEEEGYATYVEVFYTLFNDSIRKYVLNLTINPHMFLNYNNIKIVKLNEEPIFLIQKSCERDTLFGDGSGIDKSSYDYIMEKYFPKCNESYVKYGYIYPQVCYEPEVRFLYFFNDSLIFKQDIMGSSEDQKLLRIGNHEVWR